MTKDTLREYARCLEGFSPIGTETKVWAENVGKVIVCRVDDIYDGKAVKRMRCIVDTVAAEKMSPFEFCQHVLNNLEPDE